MNTDHRHAPLWRVSVSTTPEGEEAIGELLGNVFGQPASIFFDTEKRTTVVMVYVARCAAADRSNVRAGLRAARAAGLDIGSARISIRRVARENWAESWKRHFKPLEISSRLLVLPSWSRQKPRPGQALVVLDPGLSFGTGHHPTTGFCLEQVAALRHRERHQSLLDVGCGSGILSIAAAKLGYKPVVAFDFDAEAVRVAKENAAINSARIRLSRKDLTQLPMRSDRRFDVVCANLMYDLLIQERRRILSRLAPHGALVLAGILNEQFPLVRRAYEGVGLRLTATRAGKEWRSGVFRRGQDKIG